MLGPHLLIPLALILGAFVAFQFFHLTPRYVKLIFGAVFLLVITRLSFAAAMAFFLVIFPAPTFVFIGDTNVIFIGVMMVAWIVRLGLGLAEKPVRTPIHYAIWVYLLVHVLSFINITENAALLGALRRMSFMTAALLLFVLLVNAFREEKHLRGGMIALGVTSLFVSVTAISEHYFGYRLVPLWFISGHVALGSLFQEGGRAGGVFGFHGLLADFSAMMFYMQLTMAIRARHSLARWSWIVLGGLSLLNIINSANRGGAVIWVLGGLHLIWLHRRRIHWSIVGASIPALIGTVFLLSKAQEKVFEHIWLFTRLTQTQFERGIPENRVEVWSDVISRIPEHLFLGHGPHIPLERGIGYGMQWPHNAYLFYLYTTGILGLAAFLWILFKVIYHSAPRGSFSLRRDSLPRAAQAVFHVNVVMFAFAQLRDEHQRGNVYVYFMWIIFGMALVATRLVRQEEAARPALLGRSGFGSDVPPVFARQWRPPGTRQETGETGETGETCPPALTAKHGDGMMDRS